MEQDPKDTSNPYLDPTLIEQSHGDEPLLNRLVARKIASDRLAENPNNPNAQEQFRIMDEQVAYRRQKLGILPESGETE